MGEIGHKSYVYNGNFAELIMYHSFLWFMYLIHLFFNMCFPGRRRIFDEIRLKPNTKTNNIALAVCLDGLGHLFHGVNFSKVVSQKYNVSLIIYDPALATPNIKNIITESFPNAKHLALCGSYLPKNKGCTAVESSVTTIITTMACCIKALWQMDDLHAALDDANVCGIVNMFNHSIGTYHTLTKSKMPMITMAPQYYWFYCGDKRTMHPFIYAASRFCEGDGISIPLSLGEMTSRRFCLPPPLSPTILENTRSRQQTSFSPDFDPKKDNTLKIVCYGTLRGHYTVVEDVVKQAVAVGRKGFIVDMFTPAVTKIEKRVDGYLVLHPVSKNEYIQYLLNANAAMLSAGEGGPLEAAALGLRILVSPTEGHDEQSLNAALYKEKNMALVSHKFDLIRLLDFCRLPSTDAKVVAQKQAIKKWQNFLLETHDKWPSIIANSWDDFNKKQ